jgi:uncharacterized protein (DUF4213/DUF364 family)
MQVLGALRSHVAGLPRAADARTVKVRIGAFWTCVRTTVGAGMASSMTAAARPHDGHPVADSGGLDARRPLDLVSMLNGPSPMEAAVGLAAVNALLGVPDGPVTASKAVDLLLDRCRDRRVALIGRFPFAEALRPSCRELWVFERDGRGAETDHGEKEMPGLIPAADIVAITATTLLNGSLDDVLRHVAPDAWTMMLGPSTPMSPVLFELGFDVLCGTVIDDAGAVISAVSQGAVTKQIAGVRRLSLWNPKSTDR